MPRQRTTGPHFVIYRPIDFGEVSTLTIGSLDPGVTSLGYRVEKWDFVNRRVEKLDFGTLNLVNDSDKYQLSIEFFNGKNSVFANCEVLLIETQMTVNYDMIRMSQHLITYFLGHYPQLMVVELPSTLKTQMFPEIADKDKGVMKKKTVIKVLEILERRGDQESIAMINGAKGIRSPKVSAGKIRSDLSDSIIQIEAFLKSIGQLTTHDF